MIFFVKGNQDIALFLSKKSKIHSQFPEWFVQTPTLFLFKKRNKIDLSADAEDCLKMNDNCSRTMLITQLLINGSSRIMSYLSLHDLEINVSTCCFGTAPYNFYSVYICVLKIILFHLYLYFDRHQMINILIFKNSLLLFS